MTTEAMFNWGRIASELEESKAKTEYETHKFYVTLRGVEQTHELWLPSDLTEDEAGIIGEVLKETVRATAEALEWEKTEGELME